MKSMPLKDLVMYLSPNLIFVAKLFLEKAAHRAGL